MRHPRLSFSPDLSVVRLDLQSKKSKKSCECKLRVHEEDPCFPERIVDDFSRGALRFLSISMPIAGSIFSSLSLSLASFLPPVLLQLRSSSLAKEAVLLTDLVLNANSIILVLFAKKFTSLE